MATSLVLGLVWCALARSSSAEPGAAHREPKASESSPGKSISSARPMQKELESLARALRDTKSGSAYSRLASFAARHSNNELGPRAALALGYYSYSQGHYAEARGWLERARGDQLLEPYRLYWSAMVNRAMNDNAAALREFSALRREYPSSVLTDSVLESLSEAAIAAGQPQAALAELSGDVTVESKPSLLFARAQASEQTGDLPSAVRDYLSVFYHFPLSGHAYEAGNKLDWLEHALGSSFPAVSLDQHLSRAAALYAAHDWHTAQEEYLKILPSLTGTQREFAELREAQCRSEMGDGPEPLTRLQLENPELDAERLYSLSQAYRSRKQEAEMLSAIDAAIARAPSSHWADQALFAGGNYYWVQLDDAHALSFYERLFKTFPSSGNAVAASWRMAWNAYAERHAQAATQLEQYMQSFPSSPYVPDALYWLGRSAERGGNPALARTYFGKLRERFPLSYFGELGARRLKALGPGAIATVAALAQIPEAPPAGDPDGSVPLRFAEDIERARALHSIGFDASAELEYRAAYAASGSPRLLLDAAESADDAERYPAAIVTVRQLVPELESHSLDNVPEEVWRTAYPLPYRGEVDHSAVRAGVDPMLVAGLIRQESAFEKTARSAPGAIGLMQLMPKTARRVSRQVRLRYSTTRLFDPAYNLRLGTAYFADLKASYGSYEAALAAYNAGEDRVAFWTGGRKFEEPAEFVESIPFTETREYVEIVMRNAAIYRQLYGERQ